MRRSVWAGTPRLGVLWIRAGPLYRQTLLHLVPPRGYVATFRNPNLLDLGLWQLPD